LIDSIIRKAIEDHNINKEELPDQDTDSENWNAREKIIYLEDMDLGKQLPNDTESETFEVPP